MCLIIIIIIIKKIHAAYCGLVYFASKSDLNKILNTCQTLAPSDAYCNPVPLDHATFVCSNMHQRPMND